VIRHEDWRELSQLLTDLARSGPPVHYVPNTGNAGDALIASATWQLFDALGIAPRLSSLRALRGGDIAIYGGGGNLVPEYRDCAWFLKRCLAVGVARAVVLSHTVRGHEAVLRRLDERFTIICRDAESLTWVRQTASRASTLFAPDMTLQLDVPALFGWCARRSNQVRFTLNGARSGWLLKYWQWRRQAARLQPVDGLLTVLRSDIEAVPELVGTRQQDLSVLYGSSFRSRLEADFVSRDFLKVLLQARRVYTNRLHVGIGAALLGKQVQLSDNSYGKIRAVFEASLSKFNNIGFRDPPS
jgi:exopolysaccharide biosynthesis predicted pyruvyltransferase EpsI